MVWMMFMTLRSHGLGSARLGSLFLSGMGCMGLALAAWESFEAACYVWGWYCTARWLTVASEEYGHVMVVLFAMLCI